MHLVCGLNGSGELLESRQVRAVAGDHQLQIVIKKSQDVERPDCIAKAFAAFDGTDTQEQVGSGQWAVGSGNGDARWDVNDVLGRHAAASIPGNFAGVAGDPSVGETEQPADQLVCSSQRRS